MKPQSSAKTTKLAKKQIYKYSFVLYIIIMTGGLIFCVYILNNIFAQVYDTAIPNTTINENVVFDNLTVDEINMVTINNSLIPELPSGRINPFTE